MRIALFCATQRGLRFLNRLAALVPDAGLEVFSFREEPTEPPFLDTIRQATLDHGGRFHEAKQVGSGHWREYWETTPADLIFVVSWRYLIPASIYERARLGAFVFHDSLLPAYRGFSPTVWAIINGEDHTGATLFHMADDVDSGDIVAQQRVPIGPDETIAEVMETVTQTYLRLLETSLPALLEGTAPRVPQDHSRATFTCKRTLEDNEIDWNAPAEEIYNLIRAVTSPYPGATTTLDGQRIHIWSASRLPDFKRYVGRIPGRVVEIWPGRGSVVLTGDGALLITEVSVSGGDRRRGDEALNRLSHTLGRRL